MSVLIEAISVVVRRSTIDRCYPGGVAGYQRDCPAGTFCADEHLTRVAFRSVDDVGRFVHCLTMRGLAFFDGERCVDVAVVRHDTGPVADCAWLRFARANASHSVCWLEGSGIGLASPRGLTRARARRLLDLASGEQTGIEQLPA